MKKILMVLAVMMMFCANGFGQIEEYFKMSFDELVKKGNAGDVNAQHALGINYSLGEDGYVKDDKKAFLWFEKAALQGEPHSQSYLGSAYEYGWGVEQNIDKAFEWYSKAANQGYVSAQVSLADCYVEGKGVPQDCSKAIEWYEKAIAQNDKFFSGMAAYELGSYYEFGFKCFPQDMAMAKKWYTVGANLGNVNCVKALDSKAKKNDAKLKLEELIKKANGGDIVAQKELAYNYSMGRNGFKKNYKKAFKWYEKAAQNGDILSQTQVGLYYAEGLGVKKNWTKAFAWYYMAAQKGELHAMNALGDCYLEGKGIGQNCNEAVRLYIKVVEQNDSYYSQKCANKLGYIYKYGVDDCIASNLTEAKKWFKKSVELGWQGDTIQLSDIEKIERGEKPLYTQNTSGGKQRNGRFWEIFGQVVNGLAAGMEAVSEYNNSQVNTSTSGGYDNGISSDSYVGTSGSSSNKTKTSGQPDDKLPSKTYCNTLLRSYQTYDDIIEDIHGKGVERYDDDADDKRKELQKKMRDLRQKAAEKGCPTIHKTYWESWDGRF